ncbi:Oidioi.mRNA.OKI2018_I69.chr2.g7889.t1.cds [Oikopleura dioica]|uniref:Oidioi.mRNA.OKI2018_I69.chr2.g7889.t1.cds n=1 Tax=Oikopleura dioica TaxID=34765 RepID=A0ABN7T8M7_OIKDI|nr:Oidioi.mRNA.OKI2018_I69.chr2.g7889.t1.cds [Oikopleura dioica]
MIFNDVVDKLKTAKKKFFPAVWGCVGEITVPHFRGIIISQWVLLSVLLLLTIIEGILAVDGLGLLGTTKKSFLLYNTGGVVIGMIAAGFGTSIYTSQNQEGPDMAVKKALFSMTSLVFIFALLGNIGLDLLAIIAGSIGYVDPFRVINFIFNIALFFLVLVTLIMQTCCAWNKNDAKWIEENFVEKDTLQEPTDAQEDETKEEAV